MTCPGTDPIPRTIRHMEALRQLPSVEHVLGEAALAPLVGELGQAGATDLVRRALDARRAALLDGAPAAADRDAETMIIVATARALDAQPLRSSNAARAFHK